MLEYVPVRFDLYRPLKPHLRWTLQCLVAFADRAGKCWPSVRKLAEVAGIGKSTVSRHLAALERAGNIRRTRKPGGVYVYAIDARFLPARAKVSHQRAAAVPPAAAKEKPIKNKCDSHSYLEPWPQRMRAWVDRRWWLPQWGPRPDEPGCFAPGVSVG